MPETEVIYYCADDGSAPVLEWLAKIDRRDRKAVAKCAARIEVLGELGHELRRPMADYLRDGIYELRVRAGNVNYRILYFFHGQNVVVLAHGLTKEKAVSDIDIERAFSRKAFFEHDPDRHTYTEDTPDG